MVKVELEFRSIREANAFIKDKCVVEKTKRTRRKIDISSKKFINKMLKNAPDVRKSAARFGG